MIAAAAIFGMMFITCVDVLFRLFRRPIPGAYEIVSFLGAIAVSFAIAHTYVEKGHVSVTILVKFFPRRVQGIIESIISVFSIILFGFVSWQCIVFGMDCQSSGEVSMTLQIPLYPVIYGIALGAGVVCSVIMVDFFDSIVKVKEK